MAILDVITVIPVMAVLVIMCIEYCFIGYHCYHASMTTMAEIVLTTIIAAMAETTVIATNCCGTHYVA